MVLSHNTRTHSLFLSEEEQRPDVATRSGPVLGRYPRRPCGAELATDKLVDTHMNESCFRYIRRERSNDNKKLIEFNTKWTTEIMPL